ncbi:MAG: hypothetical protein DMF61_19420 [Blastocatellia bacterium AA13]|nr:MAG: hypothetical protein DMF61_19420 [Blastocatellia bacterium AA13]
MTPDEILREIRSLPQEALREVEGFVAYLHQRYGGRRPATQPAGSELHDERFIGMWQDRDDMRDSTAWVRNLRESEGVK